MRTNMCVCMQVRPRDKRTEWEAGSRALAAAMEWCAVAAHGLLAVMPHRQGVCACVAERRAHRVGGDACSW